MMNVAQLIEALKKHDPNMEVRISVDFWDSVLNENAIETCTLEDGSTILYISDYHGE
jgi:hypothetical protein